MTWEVTAFNLGHAVQVNRPHPLLIFSQSDCLQIDPGCQFKFIHWMTVQIQLSWRSQLIWLYTVCKTGHVQVQKEPRIKIVLPSFLKGVCSNRSSILLEKTLFQKEFNVQTIKQEVTKVFILVKKNGHPLKTQNVRTPWECPLPKLHFLGKKMSQNYST